MSALGELCQRCGLCCDGTLFARVSVTETEGAQLAAAGIETVLRAKNKRVLPQPCAALKDKRCGCYLDRPSGCREFVCLLGKALEEGEVSLPAALELVAETERRRATVTSALAADPEAPTEGALFVRARASDSLDVRDALRRFDNHLSHYFLGVGGRLGR